MSLRKPYFRPKIEVVSIDVDISVCMNSTTEVNQPDPGVHPGGTKPGAPEEVVNASTFKSEDTNKSFDENPFRE